jgi:hypothetical protein
METMIDLISEEAKASRKVALCFTVVLVLLIVALGM